MTREEFAILVKAMKAVYSSENFIADKDAFDVWYELLKDLSYEQANIAVQKYMVSEKFPPTIADIRTKATEIFTQAEERMSELQAWSLVWKAIQNSGYHADEEFDKLPEACKIAVGNPANLKEWALMDAEQVETVEQSHFIRNYRTALQRINEDARLPNGMKVLIADMGQKRTSEIAEKVKQTIADDSGEEFQIHTGTEMPPEAKEKLRKVLGW
jgi:hypothetical protein